MASRGEKCCEEIGRGVRGQRVGDAADVDRMMKEGFSEEVTEPRFK